MEAFLLIVLIIALIKWFEYFHGLCGVLHYMEDNNIIPTNEELKNATDWAVRNSINSIMKKSIRIFL